MVLVGRSAGIASEAMARRQLMRNVVFGGDEFESWVLGPGSGCVCVCVCA